MGKKNQDSLGMFGGGIMGTVFSNVIEEQRKQKKDKGKKDNDKVEDRPVQWLSNQNIDRIAAYTVKYLGEECVEDRNPLRTTASLLTSSNKRLKKLRKRNKHVKAVRPVWFDEYYKYENWHNNYESEYPTAPNSWQTFITLENHDKYKDKYDSAVAVFLDNTEDKFSGDYSNPYDPASAKDDDGYDTVFWYLFLAAVNADIYRDKFDDIIDTAGSYGFTEEMVRDWCRAVQFVAGGGRLSPKCDLELDSDAAREFFLHESVEEADDDDEDDDD